MSARPDRVPDAPPLPDVGLLSREYDVLREIGSGGMGLVVLARHRMASHEVAIKISCDGAVANSEALARMTREGKLLSSLRHPNIVRLFDVSDIGRGRYGIVMEYVRGVNLARIIAEAGPLPFDRCQSILWDLCAALGHAHSRGIIHRDIKPHNVIVKTDSWVAKLCDFGIALEDEDSPGVATAPVAGTPVYMAPEQIDGLRLDGRADLYSLGLLGWEMITGGLPWRGMPLFDILFHQKHTDLPELGSRRPDTPPALQFAIEGALAKDRRLRWNSASEMIVQLGQHEPTDRLLTLREARRRHADGVQMLGEPEEASAELEDSSDVPTTDFARTTVVYARAQSDVPKRGLEPPPASSSRQGRPALLRRLRMRRYARAAALVLVGAFTGTGATLALLESTKSMTLDTRPRVALAPLDSAMRAAFSAPAEREVADVDTAQSAEPLVVDDSRIVADALPTPMPIVWNSRMRRGQSSNGAAVVESDGARLPGGEASGDVENPELAAFDSAVRKTQRFVGAKRLFDAERVVDSALVRLPRRGALYALRARIRAMRRDYRNAWVDVELANRTDGRYGVMALQTALLIDRDGRAAARASLSDEVRRALTPRRMLDPERAFGLARALVVVADTATALTVLEQTTAPDPTAAPRFADPALAPLAQDPRFVALRRKVLGDR
ncbi:MAG: serine/threonine-protein kinase [Gemmatimonadaceae bacterium]